MTTAQAKAYTTQLLGHYPFTYCPTLAAKTSNHVPHRGDIVLFYNSGTYTHTGYVYQVDGTYFYTVEGNTSGASGVIANGGGVCKKTYRTASYSSSKFYRPDYTILTKAGIFASTEKAIAAIVAKAVSEVGYLEKASNANLDSKTANAGNNNYTKYWRDIYSSFQGQPWCACFVTWIVQKAIESASGSTTTTTTTTANTTSSTTSGTYDKTKLQVSKYHDSAYSGTYTVTASALYMRYGADKDKYDAIEILKNAAKVTCYGYYNIAPDETKWLAVVASGSGKTGYCSLKYLKKKT